MRNKRKTKIAPKIRTKIWRNTDTDSQSHIDGQVCETSYKVAHMMLLFNPLEIHDRYLLVLNPHRTFVTIQLDFK